MPLYIVLGQQRACMPVYIGKSGDLVRCYRCLTDTQTTEYSATQLLSSIQFKLSHAIHERPSLKNRPVCKPFLEQKLGSQISNSRFASKTLMRILPAKEKAEVQGLIEKKTITLDLYEILGKCTWTPV